MADRGDTHYSVSTLNQWFLLSSVALLVTTAWMVLHDWNRPWKVYQREFRALELSKVQAEQQELTAAGALERQAQLEQQLVAAQAQVEGRAADVTSARSELAVIKGDLWNAIEAAKKVKSAYNWDRWGIEEARHARGDQNLDKERLDAIELEMNQAMTVQQELETLRDVAQAKLDGLEKELLDGRAALAAGTRDMDQVRKRIALLDPAAMTAPEQLADVIRDAPGLDFVKPNLKVNKVVLDNLTFELNFTKKKRIDMCHTCHLGIDREGFEGDAQPSTSHPRLDLYVTSKSPHPLKEVGCTICHRGAGEALDFVRSDHRPSDSVEAAAWHAKQGWHKQHHWDYPMLSSAFVEASCVQCHKTSMELIADDAPRVTRGYRLVEQYGCYACHKIDWFPTKRRPGPTLANLQAKLSPEFITSWITNPKGFRPTTWMPQFFHLENYAPGETVVKSKYGAERAIEGREWDDASIAAIVAFLVERAPKHEVGALPVAGDAHRGREVMRLAGCLACHNLAPFGDEPRANDMALERRGTNEHGPNLRGVATKVSPEWLFRWIKDPASYWPDTRMPNLRLSDQEAADITAYITEDPDRYFHDVPEGWEPKTVAMPEAQMREVLGEQARWFFARDGRAQVEARLTGEWSDLGRLKVAVGEKLVAQNGCFSCHEISGMTEMMPIGTELSNWGSKTVDKLDFGFGVHEFGLDPEYREGWLMQKLHLPRSYDKNKVKNPTERLRMPYFAFNDEQVQSIATFVVGLVDDEVQRAKMVPTPDKLASDTGMRAVRQQNCIACHMLDPGTVTFVDEHSVQHTVTAEVLPMSEDQKVPSAHTLEALRADAAKYEATELTLRVLRPEPELHANVGDKLFVPIERLVDVRAPHGGDFVRVVTDYYSYGIELFDPTQAGDDAYSYVSAAQGDEFGTWDVDGTLRDHSNEPYDKLRWTFAPPVLWDEGAKLNRGWFFAFLNDVVPLRRQLRVRMPSFHFAPGEAGSIADYFALKSVKEWPATFTRSMRLTQSKSAGEVARAVKVDERVVHEIEAGRQGTIKANFAKLLAYAQSTGFHMRPAVNPNYEASTLHAQAYLDARAVLEPGHLRYGETLATTAVNCFQCHFRLGVPPPADPLAWAPDLALARERLREDWVRDLLVDPGRVYPGVAMPANFSNATPQYLDHYPNSTNDAQIRVVLEWLYNFDRLYMGANGAR